MRRLLSVMATTCVGLAAAASVAQAAQPELRVIGNKPTSVTLTDATGRHAIVTTKVQCPAEATGFIRAAVDGAYDGGPLGKYVTYIRCTGAPQRVSVHVDVPDYGPAHPYQQTLLQAGQAATYSVSIPLFVNGQGSPTSGTFVGVLQDRGTVKVKPAE